MTIENVDVESRKKNNSLKREEIVVKVYFNGPTPTRDEMRKKVSEKIGAKPETIIITKTNSEFGKHEIVCRVHKYDSEEILKASEPEYLLKRYGIVRDKKETENKKEEEKEG